MGAPSAVRGTVEQAARIERRRIAALALGRDGARVRASFSDGSM